MTLSASAQTILSTIPQTEGELPTMAQLTPGHPDYVYAPSLLNTYFDEQGEFHYVLPEDAATAPAQRLANNRVHESADHEWIAYNSNKVEWSDADGRGDRLFIEEITPYDDIAFQEVSDPNADSDSPDEGQSPVVWGQSVHRNEFGIEDGIFWSPKGHLLAFYRMDQSMVTDYPQVSIDPRIAELEPDKYPMAGTNTHVVTIGVYDLRTQKTLYLQTPPVSYAATSLQQPCFFTNLAWSPDGSTIYLQELNRDQNDCRLVAYDAVTGKRLKELYRETSQKYVEPLHPIQFLPWDSNLFVLQSQRDGYNHLYLFNKKGELQRQLTSGKWVVMELLGFNKKEKSIVIASNERHPLQRNIYAVDVKTGRRTLLDNGEGVHHARLSDSGSLFYDNWQSPTIPNNIDVASTSARTSSAACRLFEAPDPWADYIQPLFENGRLKAADGVTDLYYRMVKPHDFDPAKKYPTVVYVYGGPHAHNVEASWHWYSRSWETYMAQKGYIVFILDNRGSENRGRDFEQATFRQLGQVEMQDQMKGVQFLKSLPYVDSNRLGVHGWSFGGYMTISLMTNYPDVFKVGVAGGPVIDWQCTR